MSAVCEQTDSRVQGLGFRVQGLGFGVQGLGIGVQGLGFGDSSICEDEEMDRGGDDRERE